MWNAAEPTPALEVMAQATACWKVVTPTAAITPPTSAAPVSVSAATAVARYPGGMSACPSIRAMTACRATPDRGVQRGRDLAGGVGHDGEPRLGRGQVPRDLLGPVGRRADREHELELARVVLAEHVPDGLREVPFLVPDRHHDGYRWVFHDAGHGTAASAARRLSTGLVYARSYRPESSSISVTRAAIWERSDLTSVVWANSG